MRKTCVLGRRRSFRTRAKTNCTTCRRTDFRIRPVFGDGFGNPSYRDSQTTLTRDLTVQVAAVRLAQRDFGQRRQGNPDYLFSIVGDFPQNVRLTWKPRFRQRGQSHFRQPRLRRGARENWDSPQVRPIPLDAAQAAKVDAVDGACGFVGGELPPEPAVTAFAESVFVEVIVDQCSEIEHGVQSPAFFRPQPLPVGSRREIEGRHAKSSKRRLRPVAPRPAKTGYYASDRVEESVQNHVAESNRRLDFGFGRQGHLGLRLP